MIKKIYLNSRTNLSLWLISEKFWQMIRGCIYLSVGAKMHWVWSPMKISNIQGRVGDSNEGDSLAWIGQSFQQSINRQTNKQQTTQTNKNQMDLNKFWRGIAAFELLKQCEHFVPACGQKSPDLYSLEKCYGQESPDEEIYSQEGCASFLLSISFSNRPDLINIIIK